MSDLNLAIKLTTAGGNVVVKDLREIDDAADKVNHSLTDTGKSGSVAKQGFDQASGGAAAFTGSLKTMLAQAAGVIALGIGIDKIASGMYDGIDAFQGYRGQLKTITGDFDSASVELERLINLSKETPFTLAQSVEGFSKLTHLGLDPSRESMISYGNTAAAMGKDLMQMIEAVADASVGEFERLKEFGIKASSQGDNVRFTFQNVTTEIKKDAASIQQYLIDLGNNKFGDAMGDQMGRLSAKTSNLETSFAQLYDAIGSYGAADGIGGTIDSIASGVDSLKGNLPEIISTIEALSVVIGGHLVKALIASGNELLASTIATNAKSQANIELQASEVVLAKTANHKAVQEQLAAKRSLAMAKNTYARSRAINSLAAANGRAIATERALTAATIAHDSAMKKATVTSRVLGGSMALIGGPVGVAVLAAYALYEMTSGMETAKTAAEQLEEATGKTTKSIEEMTKAEQKQTAAQYAKLIQTKQAEIVKLNQSIQDNIKRGSRSGSDAAFFKAEQQNKSLEQHKKGLESLIIAYAKVQGVLFDAGMAGIKWNTVISEGADVSATLSKTAQSLVDRLDPLSAKSKQFGTEMHQLHQSYLSGALSLDEYQKLIKLLGKEFDKSATTKKSELTTNQKLIASLGEQIHMLGLTAKQKLLHTNLSKLSIDATAEEITAVKALSAAQYEQLQISKQKESDSDYYQKVIDGANDISESWDMAGNVIVNTFGTIGEQLDKLAQQQESYAKKQKKLAADKVKYADDPKKLGEITKAENALAKQKSANAMSEISSYRAITDSAASMFSENSKGREAMQAASNVFTAIELANSALRIGSYAIEAVTAAFAAPWPVGFASGAAMIAIMAGLGVAVSGGSGSAPESAEQRQKTQGTGTVFGSDEKSSSILNAYERIEALELEQYAELRQMNDSLHDLNNNITHLATSFVSNFGKFNGESYSGELGSKSTTSKMEELLIGGVIGQFAKAIDPTGIIGKIFSGFSSKKKTLVDSGISIVSQTMGDIFESGIVQAQSYYDIKTKKKKYWGASSKTSYNTQFQNVDGQLEHELALVFSNIGDSINSAVDVLGLDITKNLDNFVIDLPNISLKDLSGDEVKAELEAIFSSQSDLMATYLVPGIIEYQQVGEGLFDTLIRVAQEQAIFNSAMGNIGKTLADVSTEIEMGITQSLVELMGGIESFSESTSAYFDAFFSDEEKFSVLQAQLTSQFKLSPKTLPETREEFRALVDALKLTKKSGREAYASLVRLSPQLDEYYSQLEELEKKRQEALVSQINDLESSVVHLFGNLISGINDETNARINEEKQRINEVNREAKNAYKEQLSAVNALHSASESLNALMKSLLLSDLSTLNPLAKFDEAQSQFDALYASAANGDVDAANSLGGAASTLLTLGKELFASSAIYKDLFVDVNQQLLSVADITAAAISPTESDELTSSALLEQLNNSLIVDEAMTQTELLSTIARTLSELSVASGDDIYDLGLKLGLDFSALPPNIKTELESSNISLDRQAATVAEVFDYFKDEVGDFSWGFDRLFGGSSKPRPPRYEDEPPIFNPRHPQIPAYDTGTAYVSHDQIAQIHKSEIIIDPQSAAALRKYGINVSGSGGDNTAVVAEIKVLNNNIERLIIATEKVEKAANSKPVIRELKNNRLVTQTRKFG